MECHIGIYVVEENVTEYWTRKRKGEIGKRQVRWNERTLGLYWLVQEIAPEEMLE